MNIAVETVEDVRSPGPKLSVKCVVSEVVDDILWLASISHAEHHIW